MSAVAHKCFHHPQVAIADKFSTCHLCVGEFFARHGLSWAGEHLSRLDLDEETVVELSDILIEDDPSYDQASREIDALPAPSHKG